MRTKIQWKDEYWLMLMQLYLRKPVGIKPLYSKRMVQLSLELHIPPKYLYRRMVRLRKLDTPSMERLWLQYADNPQRLSSIVKKLREMEGFNNAEAFYEGVELKETFEAFFRPLSDNTNIMPLSLVVLLDLYFQLTPNTMVSETPEVQNMARMMGISVKEAVQVLEAYQYLDPYLRREKAPETPLMSACKEIWRQYGYRQPEKIAAYAMQLREFFK